MPDKTSYVSRFTMKFLEMVAAGIATAVSGYLVAHFTGYWSASRPAESPAVVQTAPSESAAQKSRVPKSARMQPAQPAAPAAPASAAAAAVGTHAAESKPHEADAKAHASESKAHEAEAKAQAGKAREAEAKAHASESKPHEAEAKAHASESKAREAEAKPHASEKDAHAAESKPRDRDAKADDLASVEAQVRAALAKVDASHPAAPDVPPTVTNVAPRGAPAAPVTRQVDAAPAPAVTPAPAAAPSPIVAPVNAVAIAAPATESKGQSAAPAGAQQAEVPPSQPPPAAPAPLGTVEIASPPPVAAVEPSQLPAVPATQKSAPKDKGIFATIEHLPDLLRPTSGATTADPPRPPMPVGASQ